MEHQESQVKLGPKNKVSEASQWLREFTCQQINEAGLWVNASRTLVSWDLPTLLKGIKSVLCHGNHGMRSRSWQKRDHLEFGLQPAKLSISEL